jgi:hypothetical protein
MPFHLTAIISAAGSIKHAERGEPPPVLMPFMSRIFFVDKDKSLCYI